MPPLGIPAGAAMTDMLLTATLVACVFTAVLAFLIHVAMRRDRQDRQEALSKFDALDLFRREGNAIRASIETSSGALRQEIFAILTRNHEAALTTVIQLSDSLIKRVDEFGNRLEAANNSAAARIDAIGLKLNSDIAQMGESAAANREALRNVIEERLDATVTAQTQAASSLREELQSSFQRMRAGVGEMLTQASDHQRERLDETKRELKALAEKQQQAADQLRAAVANRLDAIRQENAAKLEEMRRTVDEKLQTTLEARLGESFNRIIEQLNRAYEVFGEMRTISSNVGDLKNVLTNPKLRGTFGEVQLAMLLQDFLSPTQYIKDAQVRENSPERVEYAIRLPLADGEELLLPVDAKFPREDHEHMIQAMEAGDTLLVEHFRKQLENRIKSFAKDIGRKYINPPRTTERAILFLPTESLFAEVLRQPGLFDYVQRECNVMLAGPTTFAAILHAFQVNHRSMAIARQSTEVWKVLSAVRTEFKKYNETVGKVTRQLNTAMGSVTELGRRTRQMDRALKSVETLPDDGTAQEILGLSSPAAMVDDDQFDANGRSEASSATMLAAAVVGDKGMTSLGT